MLRETTPDINHSLSTIATMKEIVLQTFTVLLMVCLILTIILFRWERELRHTFLERDPSGNLEQTSSASRRNQEHLLRDSLVKNFETAKLDCKSSNPDCIANNSHFEQNSRSLELSKRSLGDSKQSNIGELGNNSQLVASAVSLHDPKQRVSNTTSGGQHPETIHKQGGQHPETIHKQGGGQHPETIHKQGGINGAVVMQEDTLDTASIEGLKSKQTQKLANASNGLKLSELKLSDGWKSKETTSTIHSSTYISINQSHNKFDVNEDANSWGNDTMGLHREGLKGYLVYDCSKSRKENCGGWSDRLSGILSTLVLATLTNRTFKINFDRPCVLSKYLRPNLYNWSIGHSNFENKSTSYHVLTNILYHKMGKELTPNGLRKYFQTDVSFVRMNWDLTRQFRKYRNIQKYASWITELHFSDIYFKFFNTLFKPSHDIVKELASIRKNATRSKTACAHLRIGGNPSMRNDRPRNDKNSLKTVWSFLDQFDTNIYNIFVATDDDTVRKTARERYKDTFIDISGSIMHIDQSSYRRGDVCDGFKKQLLDFLFLATCDVLVLSNSGFGMMAAYLRTHKTGLHCWTDTGIVPCSRYTVHDFYPLPILAPD